MHVVGPAKAEHGGFPVRVEPLVEVIQATVTVEDDAVVDIGLRLIELCGLTDFCPCGELDLVAVLLFVLLHLNGNLVEALVVHQVVVPAFHHQRSCADEEDGGHHYDGLPGRQGACAKQREGHDDDERIAEYQRAMLEDRLTEQGVDEGDGEDDDKPCEAGPTQRLTTLAALAEDEGQEDDDAHGKHEQHGVVHRVLDEVGEEGGFGCTQPAADAAAHEELLPEDGQGGGE